MQEDIKANPIYLFFTKKEKIEPFFKIVAKKNGYEKILSDIISNWDKFSNEESPLVYFQGDTIEVNKYDKEKLNNSQYILVHDNYNAHLEFDNEFVFFSHSGTNAAIKRYLEINSLWIKSTYESAHEINFNNVDTPYYQFAEGLINYLKSKDK